MAFEKVIVFGPTGNIASVAARTAHEQGAEVVLAMRDTSKSIAGLSPEEEKSGRFTRVEADLTNPDSVAAAVSKTGAKSAFFYVAHGMKDHMKSTIQALKDSGIVFVVFLSSYTVARHEDDLAAWTPSEVIPYIHAQVEIQLEDIYGPDDYVAVRPGGFATNTLLWKAGIADGELLIPGPNVRFDWICPTDMGKVSGKILVTGRQNGEKGVYLYGPQLLSQKDAIATVSRKLGKEVKVTTPADMQEAMETFSSRGFPPPVAKYAAELITRLENGSRLNLDVSHWEACRGNVERYTGEPATSYDKWVDANLELFRA